MKQRGTRPGYVRLAWMTLRVAYRLQRASFLPQRRGRRQRPQDNQEKGNTMRGYYVDEGAGRVCSTATPPFGCHFEFKDKEGFREVWIVANQDG